ncbi:DUF975 family protein [Butyrivibrio sp. INlla21]|uniref:DUF975 family protein n=1 Tax=Butyrivibrio sp. INlla21 TaxID=1520811 RepID=UPI0008E1DAD8|nr:DUF975 family protein [Butyrivibrio sp. INlla21]SFV02949.1 Uncharacterized membrane protein [Butyrivibrio sp. INlla21]
MTELKSSSELKAIAKEKSLDKYGTLIFANILIFAIQFIVSALVTVSGPANFFLFCINELITLVISILVGILVSGKAYLYMNLLYSQAVSTSDIFFGFKQHPNKAVTIQALFVVVDFLVSIPGTVIFYLSRTNPSSGLIGVLFIFIVLGLIINVYVSLTYSQAFFLLHDYPDKSAKELLAYSKEMMKGHRFRLLYLHISFIPLMIFGVITLFIPLLWISVYRYATLTAFYQDLIVKYGNAGKVDYGLN